MSWQAYADGTAYGGYQQGLAQPAGYEHLQSQYYAPPDVLVANSGNPTGCLLAPIDSTAQQQSEYDPFEYQPNAPPMPADNGPPPLPPAEEAPPLPEDLDPPLPLPAAAPQDQPLHPAQADIEHRSNEQESAAYQHQQTASQQQFQDSPAPLQYEQPEMQYQASTMLPPVNDAQPDSQTAWQAHQYPGPTLSQPLTQPAEPIYQYPGAAYSYAAPQQSNWQQSHQSQPYAGYAQPQVLHQQPPWQPQSLPQPQPYWQHPHRGQQHYQAGGYQTPAPMQPQSQPQPVVLPAPVEPAPKSQAPPRVVADSKELFLKPGRSQRPKRVAIVLRGLPGSGKSHLAKKMKDVEVQQGGEAPRIHAIDDYFVTVSGFVSMLDV